MAKVTGPLMSMDASGAFGGAMVFGKWKGRNTVRQFVTPSNPKSADQQHSRNIVKIAGKIQHVINYTDEHRTGLTVSDKEALRAAAPSGQAWNGYVLSLVAGSGDANYDAATTAWNATTKANWQTAALALPVPYHDIQAQVQPGASPVTITAGEQFFRHEYALFLAGIAPAPTTTPPTYS